MKKFIHNLFNYHNFKKVKDIVHLPTTCKDYDVQRAGLIKGEKQKCSCGLKREIYHKNWDAPYLMKSFLLKPTLNEMLIIW